MQSWISITSIRWSPFKIPNYYTIVFNLFI